jgi:hypothetical protein
MHFADVAAFLTESQNPMLPSPFYLEKYGHYSMQDAEQL